MASPGKAAYGGEGSPPKFDDLRATVEALRQVGRPSFGEEPNRSRSADFFTHELHRSAPVRFTRVVREPEGSLARDVHDVMELATRLSGLLLDISEFSHQSASLSHERIYVHVPKEVMRLNELTGALQFCIEVIENTKPITFGVDPEEEEHPAAAAGGPPAGMKVVRLPEEVRVGTPPQHDRAASTEATPTRGFSAGARPLTAHLGLADSP